MSPRRAPIKRRRVVARARLCLEIAHLSRRTRNVNNEERNVIAHCAAPQSLSLNLQSVWWKVNKSESLARSLSLYLSICDPPSLRLFLPSSDEEKITRSTAHSGRRPSRDRARARARASTIRRRKMPCRPRVVSLLLVHVREGIPNGLANSISKKAAPSLALSLDIFPQDLSLPYQED